MTREEMLFKFMYGTKDDWIDLPAEDLVLVINRFKAIVSAIWRGGDWGVSKGESE